LRRRVKRYQFQSTRPRGARQYESKQINMPGGFNPRARVGRDEQIKLTGYPSQVSIHAPAWGATKVFECASQGTVFQSTRPRGARHQWDLLRHGRKACFNPRARVGRDDCPKHGCEQCLVSIHAPAWGATLAQSDLAESQAVSIHAPAWGATLSMIDLATPTLSFNPRARVGRDLSSSFEHSGQGRVSIHAPAWGATRANRRWNRQN